MYSYAQPRALPAMALLGVAAVLRSAAYRVRAAARRLDAWIANRRADTPALRELQAMSYRELRDIGLTGFDVQHLAWGGEAPGRPWQEATETEAPAACEACSAETGVEDRGDVHGLVRLAHLPVYVLKDIGAPHWLVAHAAGEGDREHLRWIGFDHR